MDRSHQGSMDRWRRCGCRWSGRAIPSTHFLRPADMCNWLRGLSDSLRPSFLYLADLFAVNQRQTLQTTINDNGATYHGDLTRVVTHLVAARPQGPKYDRAKAWGLKTVSLKWFQESIERGMVLEESLYEPRIPLDEQGNGAFTRDYQRQISPRKRQRADGDTSTTEDAGKRKMRRTASTRLSSHSQSLWADMSGFEDQTTAQNDNQWGDTSETLQLDESDNAPHAPLQGRNAASILGAHEPRPISRTASLPQEEQGLFSNMLCLVRGHDMKIVGRQSATTASRYTDPQPD